MQDFEMLMFMEIFGHKEQERQEEGVWGFALVLKPSSISCTTC